MTPHRRIGPLVALLIGLPAVLGAQVDARRSFPAERAVSVTAGVGNAMGWFGAQGERYFLDERVSVFVGLGYTPSLDQDDPTGPTFAAGIRSYTAGTNHRAFLEGAVSQVLVENGRVNGGHRLYGPGAQAGYQYVAAGGFTIMASVGAGYALGVPRGVNPWGAEFGVSLGYTWRRSPSVERPAYR